MRNLLLTFCLFFIGGRQLFAQNCSINAGLSVTICQTDVMMLNGTRSGLLKADSLCTWTQIAGPSVTINTPHSLISNVSGYGAGTYTFKLTIQCLDGYNAEDTVSIIVPPLTIANAGPDATYCPLSGLKLEGNKLQNAGETGVWTLVGLNMGGINVVHPDDPTSDITLNPSSSGMTKLKWTITNNSGCVSSDEVEITNRGGISPVNAGPDQYLDNCFSTSTCAFLVATNGGEGFGGQTSVWTFISGPTVPSMTNNIGPKVKVCNLSEGEYVFRYTVTGPCVNGSDEVKVIVPPASQEVTPANPNPAGSNTFFCGVSQMITLSGNLPSYSGEAVLWTQVEGPPVTITNPDKPSTTVTGFKFGGTYCFNYQIMNVASGCNSKSVICYTFDSLGTVDGGPDQILPCNVTSTYIYPTVTGNGNLLYRILSGPPGPYNYPSNYTKHNGFSGLTAPGTYRVELNYSFGDGCPAIFDYVDITVSRPPTGSNAGSFQNFACAATSTQLAGNNPALTGVGIGKWSQVSGPNTANLLTPNNYICDVKGTHVGTYTFRWTITGGNECPDNFDDIVVVIPDSSVTPSKAGADRTVCANSPISLTGNTCRADETAKWTVSPGGVTFSPNNTVPTPIINGLAPNTTYTFIYTILNSCGIASMDTVKITTTASNGPSAAFAGADECLPQGTNVIQLKANVPVIGSGMWKQLSGPACTIINPSSSSTPVNVTGNGTYQFSWTISDPGCVNSTSDTVVATISSGTTQAIAGADITACATSSVLNGNTPLNGTGLWSQISGDGTAVITTPTSPVSTVKNLLTGQYTFRWTISNGACLSSTDDVTLKISSPPSTANAGSDITLCNTGGSAITLNALKPLTGKGQWLQVTGPNEATITNDASPNTTLTGLANGNYIFRWMVTGGPTCPVSSDDMNVNISYPANAGKDQNLCNTNSTLLSGNIGSTGIWSQVSGPSATIIQAPPGNHNANITGLIPGGTYTFKYTMDAVFGCPVNSDNVVVTNGAVPTPYAGVDTSFCNASSFTLNGNIPLKSESGSWSILSGPAGGVFSPNANVANPTLNGASPGIYILKWTLTNGTCSSSDIKRVDNFAPPSPANAGTDKTVCNGSSLLQATSPPTGIGTWTEAAGASTIDAINNPVSAVRGLDSAGIYKFVWTVSNGKVCPVKRDTVNYIVPSFANAGNDQVLCEQYSTILSANIVVGGAGTWKQVYGPAATIVSPGSAVTNVTGLQSGVSRFAWNIITTDGNCNSSDTVTITNGINANKAFAGPDDTLCGATSISLTGNAPANGANGTWSFVSGPATPVFGSKTTAATKVSGLSPGTYKFTWTIYSPCSTSTDEVNITILRKVDAANAGPDQKVCSPSAMLHANPPTGTNKAFWSQFAGPVNAVISSPSDPDITLSNLVPGTYCFVWTIYNEKCSNTDTTNLVIHPAATVKAGDDFSLCSYISSIPLSGSSLGGAASTATWSIVAGGGTLSNTSSTSTPDKVSYSPQGYTGPVVIRLSASDMCHIVSDDIVLNVKPSELAFEAMDDHTHTDPNTPVGITILSNDHLPETSVLKPCNQNTLSTPPANGTADLNSDGTVTYTPHTGFYGIDSFQYKICNGNVLPPPGDNCVTDGKDNAWVYITVEGCVLPNAFSPNGDGVNDVFEIPCAQGDVEFHVYNRWGIEVYRNDKYANDWDGTYQGSPLPDGTYYYVVKYISEKNYSEEKEGFISLHR